MDTVETRIAAWLRTFEEFHVPADRNQVARLIGSDGRRLARLVAEAAGQHLNGAQAEAIDRRAGEIYGELNTDPRPLPGARELLNALSEMELPWAIATSSRREQVTASVDALRLAAPPTIIDGGHVANAKPAPDLLLYAARKLRVEPALTWYVGDAIWDMQAARAAGMPAVGVTTGSATAAELTESGAWLTIGDLGTLLARVDQAG